MPSSASGINVRGRFACGCCGGDMSAAVRTTPATTAGEWLELDVECVEGFGAQQPLPSELVVCFVDPV